jgi:hypothetical protein
MDKQAPERKTVVETAWLGLKAPVEWFEQLDAWREQQDFTPKPSRPAAIRWIVHQFLVKQGRRNRKRRARA